MQVLSVGFQGGHVTHASIVGRRGEETKEGETFDVTVVCIILCTKVF